VERVSSFDAYHLHLHEHVVVGDDRIRHVLVPENIGTTSFVIDSSFHRRLSGSLICGGSCVLRPRPSTCLGDTFADRSHLQTRSVTRELFPKVGPEALPEIADLCARSVAQPLTPSELLKALFAPDQPASVRFSPGVGLVATVRDNDDGFIRMIAVDPDHRSRGYGHMLVTAAESDLAGTRAVTVGADPPYFLFPGVPTTEPELCYLLERHHFMREEVNYNVLIDVANLPESPSEVEFPRSDQREEIEVWSLQHWPNWRPELLRAFDQGSLVVSRDPNGIACACAFDVNRSATLGPIASRPDLIGKGAGKDLLLGALHHMSTKGYEQIEVLWVGPLVPYFRVGGRIGSLFMVYRKRRRAPLSQPGHSGGPGQTKMG
jgi:GNAT superfamily N-acetyltransferase